MQLVARRILIFVCIFSAKYMTEAVLTGEKTVVYKHCSEGGDQEMTRVNLS